MKKYNFLRKTKKIMNKHVFCRRIGGVKSIYLVYGTKNNGLERLLLPFPKPLFFNRVCLFSCIFVLSAFPVHAACQAAAYQQDRQQRCIGNRTVPGFRENCKRYYRIYDLVDHIARR